MRPGDALVLCMLLNCEKSPCKGLGLAQLSLFQAIPRNSFERQVAVPYLHPAYRQGEFISMDTKFPMTAGLRDRAWS